MTRMSNEGHPFEGIAKKLERANENIVNLKIEISAFLKDGKYPDMPDPNSRTWQKAVDYHRTRPIPKRFSVLAGEIVHHLRSSLDHIVWYFSDIKNAKAQSAIEFPIFDTEPVEKEHLRNYERKIKGISSPSVLKLIKDLQPYNAGTEAADDSLLIVHNMDKFDKHRELVIVNSAVWVTVPANRPDVIANLELYKQGKLHGVDLVHASREFRNIGKASSNVAFGQFGKRNSEPVISGLMKLLTDVELVVSGFEKLIDR